MKKITVVFFAANPLRTDRLMLDEEIRAIQEKMHASTLRESVELVPVLATRPGDMIEALNRHKPHIVHISAHGSKQGELKLADGYVEAYPVTADAFRSLFTIVKDNVRLVILNACDSEPVARAVAEVVDCAIGMNARIGDMAAIVFSTWFYSALGYGRSVKEAFEQGKLALILHSIPEENTPQLYTRQGIDPDTIYLLAKGESVPEIKSQPAETGTDTAARNMLIDERDFLKQVDLTRVSRISVLAHTGRSLYNALYNMLDDLLLKGKNIPEEVRLLARTPVVEGIYRNRYIQNTITQVDVLRHRRKKQDIRSLGIRFYEAVPSLRGIICEYPDNKRISYVTHYWWPKPNASKASPYAQIVHDTKADPHPEVEVLESWIEQYWGRDEIHTLVFDFDDTLVFSGEVQIQAWTQVVIDSLQGGEIKVENLSQAVRPFFSDSGQLVDKPGLQEAVKTVFVEKQMAEAIIEALFVGITKECEQQINSARFKLREAFMEDARLFDGVEQMLTELNHRYNFAIISSTDEQMISSYLHKKDLERFFPLILGKRDPTLRIEHDKIYEKSMLLIKLSEIIGIPLSRMVYIGDNCTDYKATSQIGIPFIEARQAALRLGKGSFIGPVEPKKPPLGWFDSFESDSLPSLLRRHSQAHAEKKYVD